MLPPQTITNHEGFLVVRDDLIAGGTKRRVLSQLFNDMAAKELVYPSVPYGSGPVAVAYSARDTGRKAVLFYPDRKRKNWSPQMVEAEAAGAKIVPSKAETSKRSRSARKTTPPAIPTRAALNWALIRPTI
jgi:hypothetical protein